MNMISNLALQQLDEVSLQAPLGILRPAVTQADIDAGVARAHVLRAQAVTSALRRLLGAIR